MGKDYGAGKDAASITPKFVPPEELLPRDNSGGIDYESRTAVFGDGYDKAGEKASLSASGGNKMPMEGTEQSQKPGERGSRTPGKSSVSS